MKMTAIYGSPQKNGNSAALVKEYLRGAAESKAELIGEHYLYDKRYDGCVACMSCRKAEDAHCALQDDMQQIYQDLESSDVIVVGSPLYWWSISSRLKMLIDRLYRYIGTDKLSGKKIIVFMTGISQLPNSGYDLTQDMLREIFGYLQMDLEFYPVSADDDRPAGKNAAAMQQAFALGKAL